MTTRSLLHIALFVGIAFPPLRQLPAQITRDTLGAAIAQDLRDTNVFSPITGARVPAAAVRVAIETITASNPDSRTLVSRALETSGVRTEVLDQLLASLPELGAQPNSMHVVDAQIAFNRFVNSASPRFLVDPPAEFLALHAILLRVSETVHR